MNQKKTYDVTVDVLVIGGTSIGPGGETERFSIAFPDAFEVKDSNNGDVVASKNPATSATLTVTFFPTDETAAAVAALERQMMTPGDARQYPGSAFTFSDGQVCQFDDCVIVQRPGITSSKSPSTQTATFTLVNAKRL